MTASTRAGQALPSTARHRTPDGALAGRRSRGDGRGRRSAPRQSRRRIPGAPGPLLVDVLAPAYLVAYVVVVFDAFTLLFPLPPNTSLLVAIGGFGLLLITPSERLGRLPIVWSVVAFVGWNVLSLAWSEIPQVTIDLILVHLIPLAIAALVVGTMPPKVVVKTLVSLMVVLAGWTMIISLLLPMSRAAIVSAGPDGNQPGFRGTFGHKNVMGVFAVYSLCLILPFFRAPSRRWVVLLCVALVISTRSATAASGLMAVLFAWFWIAAIDGQKTSRERQFLGVVSVFSAIAGLLLAIGAMPALLGLYQKDLTFSGRTFIWAETLKSWKRQPIQGYGYGGVWWDGRSPVTQDLQQRIGFGAAHAHNGAIELLITVGLVGLVLFLVLLVRVIRLSGWCFGRKEITRYGQWGILMIPAMILMSVSEPLFRVPSLAFVVILAVVLTRVRNDHLSSADAPKRFATTF